ncbi:BTB And C-terminal Kelch [Elasticomyces elasticus]|nr:BTB And C-terminal Kelch [Elasticomyces elasticus]
MEGNFSHLFGNKMFSDVVVKYGDRELPAHRMVLTQVLPYFKKLLEDKAVKTIKLDDNGHPDAIEGMLRDLYGLPYELDDRRADDWRFQLHIAAVGSQYKVAGMRCMGAIRFVRLTNGEMDMGTVEEVLRALSPYRHVDKLIADQEQAIMKKYSRELLELPDFSDRFEMEPGARLPDLLQDPEFVKRFDAQPGRAVAYLVQFGKAFRDLEDKLTEYQTIWPQHFREITEQATKTPNLPQPIVQQPTTIKEECHQPVHVAEERQQPVGVKEERKQQPVKVKDEPKEAPSKKRKTDSVVRIEID